MDVTRRRITKIAREVSKFTVRSLKKEGVGTSEYDFIHVVRKNPGITQAKIREILGLDKGAAARRAASLESKGYLERKSNPLDGRSQLLYATTKADELKVSKAEVERIYYEWLLADLSEEEKNTFTEILNKIYEKSKEESKSCFQTLNTLLMEKGDRNE